MRAESASSPATKYRPGVATGLLADHANHHRANKAAEVADRVNRGDTRCCCRAAQEHLGILHSGGFDALMPTVTSVKATITVKSVLTLPA